MKKILIFSVPVLIVFLYAFQTHIKSQKDQPQKTILTEKQNPVELNLASRFSKIKLEFRDNLWFMTKPHLYPADQDFIGRNLDIMKKASIISSFSLKEATRQVHKIQEDPYGFNPPKGSMEIIHQDGLKKRFLLGKTKAPRSGLYLLDKDSARVFVVHSLFGQFFYYPLSMFLSKNLPIQGEKIKKIRIEKSDPIREKDVEKDLEKDLKIVWEIKNEDQSHATVVYRGKTKKIPKQKLFSFFETIKNFELTDHEFKPVVSEKSETSHPLNKTLSLSIETEKSSNHFDFDYKKREFYSHFYSVSARFKLTSLKKLEEKIKKLVEEEEKPKNEK